MYVLDWQESTMITYQNFQTENACSEKKNHWKVKPQKKCQSFSGEMGILETESEETRNFWDQRFNWFSISLKVIYERFDCRIKMQ